MTTLRMHDRKNQIQTGGVHTQEEIKQEYSKLLENIEMLQNEEIISDTPLVNAVNEYKQNVINLYEGLQTNKNNVFFSEQIQKINDGFPLLGLRKYILKIMANIKYFS
jgi:hypothetical protein